MGFGFYPNLEYKRRRASHRRAVREYQPINYKGKKKKKKIKIEECCLASLKNRGGSLVFHRAQRILSLFLEIVWMYSAISIFMFTFLIQNMN